MRKTIGPKEILARRDRRLKLVTLVILLAGVAGLFYWWKYTKDWATTNDAYVTGNVVTLKALTSGIVAEIAAENTQFVTEGQVLVRLDGVRAKIALDQAEAELGETVRHVETLFNQPEILRQRIAAQEAGLARVQHDIRRYRNAIGEGGISAQQLQNAEDQARELEATLHQARAELRSAEAVVQGTGIPDHPMVLKAQNALRQAYLEYVRKDIVAPVSGYIAKRRVQVGDQVQPGAPLLAIVPLDYLWVEANYLETELARIRPGQAAVISVDAVGGEVTYHGVVEGLHPGTGSVFGLLPPENATGNYIHIVERLPVRIGLAADELKAHPLRPGLSTVTRIDLRPPGEGGGAHAQDLPPGSRSEAGRPEAPALQSLTTTHESVYRTSVYKDELADVEKLIKKIVEANRLPMQ
jgi:membrane fusion protein, multidrug efflux system